MDTSERLEDPTLAAEIERAVAPYRALFPAEAIATMEDILEHALTTHPVGAALLDRVRPRAAPDRSGSQAKDGAMGGFGEPKGGLADAKKARAK
jgi:hypothetical protein